MKTSGECATLVYTQVRRYSSVPEGHRILAGGGTTGTASNNSPSPGGATDQVRSVAPPGLGEASLSKFALEAAPTPEGARVRLAHDHELARLLAIAHGAGGRLVLVNPACESLEDLFVREVDAGAK